MKRDVPLFFRVSKSERDLFQRGAKKTGLSLSSLMRLALRSYSQQLSLEIEEEEEPEPKGRRMVKIGRNARRAIKGAA